MSTGVGRAVLGALVAMLAVCVFGGSVGTAAPTGLVAAYSFNEGSGTTVADTSGSGNNGTISGALWNATGKFGKSLSFSPSRSSYVSIQNSASLQLSSLTLEAWVNPAGLSGAWRTVVFKERPSGMTWAMYAANDANRPVGQVYTTGEQNAAGTTALPLNSWTHLAVTYGGGALKLYVNGTQAASVAHSAAIVSSAGLLKIGGNATWGEYFNGLIDEVRVYNRVLTAAEIQSDMNAPVGPVDTTPPSAPGTLTATGGLGQVSLGWGAATDNVGVAKYDVHRSTTPGFTPSAGNRIAQPAGTNYTDSGLAPGTYYYRVAAEDAAGNIGPPSNEASATVSGDTTPPTATITAPVEGAAVSGTASVTATASDNGAVAGVQFKLDGVNLGGEDTVAPYSVQWDTTTASNGNHTLVAVARDTSNNTGSSSPVGVSVQNQPAPNFAVDTLVTGLDQPTQLLFTPDGRMLILERAGKVLVVQPGASQPDATPFLVLNTVNFSDERGALGIVLDPQFTSNGWFYVMYTHSSLLNRVSRFTAVGNSASASSEVVIWQNDEQAAIYHQGGGLAFGPDGKLYISVGDNLNRATAQSLSSFNGKILRINKDGTIPSDNPFVDGSGPNDDAIWVRGLRNPFRFTFDSEVGRMIIADVGEGTWEEVNVGARGANYGWPTCEGECGASGMTDPIFSYNHNGRDASITGGFVYHGNQFGPSYDGSYFYGDYAQNVIRRLTFDGAGAVDEDLPFVPDNGDVDGPYGDPVDIREGPDGALYYVDIGPLDVADSGTVRRVRNLNGNLPPSAVSSASPTSGAAPLTVSFSSAGSSDPEGAQLSYLWTFGDGTTSTADNPSHSYGVNGVYTARLNVSDGVNTSFAAPIQITVGGAPQPTITSPTDGSMFQAAQTINLSGSATDPNDGQLSGSALKWTVVFHHETHQHPGPGPFFGGTASFTTPSSGHDFTGNTSYEIVLTATNSSGISASTSVFIYPRKVNMTFTSAPQGMNLVIDDLPLPTPYTVDTLVGFSHTVDAPSPQALGGSSYTFTSWSDGGARTHTIVVPSTSSTLTATYSALNGPRPGLVAAYNFNEGSGTSVGDSSGNGNVGSITSATWSTSGKYGRALSFNGTSARVNVPASASLDLTTGMTLEAWVNPTGLGAWRTVIFKERAGGMNWSLYASNSSNRPVGQLWLGNAEQDAVGTAALALNTWTHLAATYDGSALRLYVNGNLVSTLSVSGTLAKTTLPLRIGGNTIWGEYFRGLIDDIRVYNRALTPSEIASDMTTPVGP